MTRENRLEVRYWCVSRYLEYVVRIAQRNLCSWTWVWLQVERKRGASNILSICRT